MPTEKTLEVLRDVAAAIGDANAQLPTAKELVKLLGEANEDTTEVQGLVTEIEARIRQWTRIIERAGLTVEPPPPSETE
ncbi:hypothetical protein LCGC14_1577280 [marine sediment metagenome]|uniref:Uncharacterized protein n=1 Tax=marine sediment metagenome TaxID=412755 RepID=A0A0F9LI35_9ZZZZ